MKPACDTVLVTSANDDLVIETSTPADSSVQPGPGGCRAIALGRLSNRDAIAVPLGATCIGSRPPWQSVSSALCNDMAARAVVQSFRGA